MPEDSEELPPATTEFGGLNPGELFARVLAGRRTSGGARSWTPPSLEELRSALPQYGILALAGCGGMGAVYKGWQKSLDRHVAIKVLPAAIVDGESDFWGRFKREAKAMARLSHPNIVAVHDAGEAGGLLYFVMDFVEGTDVHRLVTERGRLPLDQALSITARVCDALAYAHGKGIIHRDIKPSNIMVDPEGQVKVADFGLVKVASAESALLTASNVAIGTLDFMAPEARSDSAHVDHRADLYAVGVMLYQMVTGQLPRGRFDPPSRVVPGLDKRLDGIVDRTLQNDRDARYSSAIELKAALEPVLTRSIARRAAATASEQRSVKKPALLGTLMLAVAVASFLAFRSLPTVPEVEARKLVGLPPAGGPATAPSSRPSADVALKFPAGQWVKPFTKIEDFPAEVRGALSSPPGSPWFTVAKRIGIGLSDATGRNWGMRAVFRRNANDQAQLQLRRSGRGIDFRQYNFGIVDNRGMTQIAYHAGKPGPDGKVSRSIASKPLVAPIPDGAEYTLEFIGIGSTLIARVNGQVMAHVQDNALMEGAVGIYSGEPFRDLEVINLDGLPEAEARKLVGLPPAAGRITAPSSRPSADVAVKFPPAKWVKPFPNLADFPVEFRESITLDPATGWFTPADDAVAVAVPDAVGRNWGARASFQRSPRPGGQLQLRRQKNLPDWQQYTFAIVDPAAMTQIAHWSMQHGAGQHSRSLISRALTAPVRAAEAYTLEFYALGSTLLGRVNGALIARVQHTALAEGDIALYPRGEPFRDFEVINLDGLPEAEALKLVGVPSGAAGPFASAPSSAAATPADATKDAPFVNTLGMKFVPVPILGGPTGGKRVLFSVWETRVQDFEVFTKEAGRKWQLAESEQGPAHPATRVGWNDAQDFCLWLTARERKEGRIAANERYRLPSDHEWSCAAGIGGSEAAESSPAEKHRKTSDVYPWGMDWPAACAPGNFSGEEVTPALRKHNQFLLAGHRDDFPYTAPVGSFPAGTTGLYDLAGNAMEWCEDWSDPAQTRRVLRGGSWFNASRDSFLSSTRSQEVPKTATAFISFRVVLSCAQSLQ